MFLKEAAKRLIALTPFRVVRGVPNRSPAIGYCLHYLSRLGYEPASPAQKTVDVEATALDRLFSTTCKPSDRTLLKIDLQGHELSAMEGASRLLRSIEVAFVKTPFFDKVGQPTVSDITGFFCRSGFHLFDVASLSGHLRDNRLREGDFVFVRKDSPISADAAWS